MMTTKLETTVDIILPVGVNSPYLEKCLESLMKESYQSWRVVAILDSGDEINKVKLMQILEKKSLLVIEIPSPHTLSQKLNAGIAMSAAKYVARMDADDIFLNDRLTRQVEFLEDVMNESIIGIGANAVVINGEDKVVGEISQPHEMKKILSRIIWRNTFVHPSMMFRRDVLLRHHYDPRLNITQDYELWLRILAQHKMINLGEILLGYRQHASNSSRRRVKMLEALIIYRSKRAFAESKGFSNLTLKLSTIIWTLKNILMK